MIFRITRNACLIFSLLVLSCSIFAQSKKIFEKNIIRGLEQSYHFKWDKAEETFKGIIKKYPNRPEGYHYLSGIYVWYYLSSKDKNELNNFTAYSDTTIEKGLELLDRNPNSDTLLYLLGSNYSYRAIAFAAAENYLDAVWAGKKSNSYLEETIEINPEKYDAYLGLGLYNFAAGQTPGAFRWVLKLAGMGGDKELGISYLKLAADEGTYSKIEAQYYYSQVTQDSMEGMKYLTKLVNKYPENILFKYSLASLNIKERKLNDAEKILRKVVNYDNEKFLQVVAFSNFLIGDVFYKKNQFDSAIVHYKKFLEITPDNDYTGIASFRLGVSYEITGFRDSAVVYFAQCENGNMDLDDDIYAKRKGSIYLERTLFENEIAVIKANNMIEAGNYRAAYDSLGSVLKKIISNKLKAEAYLYLNEAAFNLGKYDESLSLSSAAIKTEVKDEKWILPYACYYAARANYYLGDKVATNYFIEQAEDYNDYDYQNKLKTLINSLKQKEQL
jgi:predicted negative regulator of RcsB-dependent stress response